MLSRNLPVATEENKENLNQESRARGLHLRLRRHIVWTRSALR